MGSEIFLQKKYQDVIMEERCQVSFFRKYASGKMNGMVTHFSFLLLRVEKSIFYTAL